MESHEVLRTAVDRIGAKKAAAVLRVSSSLVYKWCEAPAEPGAAGPSGSRNPLDRVRTLMECTEDPELLNWLCSGAGGVFVADPAVPAESADAVYLERTQQMLRDFSELLRVVAESYADDGRIDRAESDRIRREWNRLKQRAEGFVRACEAGVYNPAATAPFADTPESV